MLTRVVTGLVAVLALAAWSLTAVPAAGEAAAAHSAPGASESGGPAHGSAGQTSPAHGESGKGGGVDPLDFQVDLALWTGVVFLLLLFILSAFAWRPIARGLKKRETRIADEIASAERTNAEARQLLDDYQQRLAASGEEIRQMLEDGRREAEKSGQTIVDKARDEGRAEHQRALEEIELATADALKELAERSADLAVDLAGKIVSAQLDPNSHARLIEQAVSNFPKAKPGNN
ncbi:MAG TPA: F0F1 ATP synthase subunit B [Thermoguttaceae bacterium]|nr:F0F1 ATP synthase subunit B [Thermoguttaceae bacterium]